jgi:carnitine 3-dehydrogenase
VDGTAEQVGPRSIKQLERYRDDCITSVLAAIAQAKARHGLHAAE